VRLSWKKLIALATVMIFTVFTVAPSWAFAETINLDGGTVEVNTQDNTTNWNVSGNPVWNVPEFNIAQGSTYNIAGLGQGSSLALLVNGGNASNIFGTMNLSNLAFILQNIAGINIGSTGMINLNNASLIASTLPLNLDATHFLSRDYQFSGQGGFLTNDGKIIGNNADLVALIANAIENRGVIDVPMGTVALATGDLVTVGISGDGLVSIAVEESTANDMGLSDQIRNTGTISADGGRVILSAKAMDGLFDKAINIDQDGSALSVIKANNGSIEFVNFGDFYNSGALSASNGRILVDSKGNITNEGTLNALNGSVEMTAGQSVYNKNLIEALGGKIGITAKEGEVENTGTVDVTDGVLKITAREDVINQALMKAVNGEIQVTSTGGDLTNAGTMDATKGSIELAAAGTIETQGVLKADTIREHGYTFKAGGLISAGHVYMDNLDGAADITEGMELDVDTFSDTGDINVLGNFSLLRNVTIQADAGVSDGFGKIVWGSGYTVTGNNHNLTLKASEASTIGSINGVNVLTLQESKLNSAPTFTSNPTATTWQNITDFRISSGKLNRYTGNGSVATPYQIYDVYGLQGMNGYLGDNKIFQLSNDITASSTSGWNGGLGFDPIGSTTNAFGVDPNSAFYGTFDGRNYIITGLTINRPLENFVGLFGVTKDTTIQNVGLVGGNVTGLSVVGDLVGYLYRSAVTQSYATGNVSGAAGGNYVGGLVGANYQASGITNSYASGDVTGSGDGAGGLVGYSYVSDTKNSFATGTVSGGGTSQGGLIGKLDDSTFSNNWWWKDAGHNPTLSDTGDAVYGDLPDDEIAVEDTLSDFYGSDHSVYLSSSTEGWDFDAEWLGDAGALPVFGVNPNTYLWVGTGLWSVASNWSRNGVEGVPGAGSVVAFNATSNGSSTIDAGFTGTPATIKIKDTYAGTITQGTSLNITGSYIQEGGTFISPLAQTFTASSFSVPGGTFNRFSGSGTSGDPYKIHDAYGLQGVKGFLSSGTYLELDDDIDLLPARFWNYKGSGLTNDPLNYSGFDTIGNRLGSFAGNFNGAMHTISNLPINRSSTKYVGLFGRTSGATVRNVALVGGSVLGGSQVGSLVGNNYESTVANSYATTDVTGSEWVGGLVGYNEHNAVVSQSYATGDVTNTGSISQRGAGGLVGANWDNSLVTKSYATGDVQSNSDAGGLVGAVENMSAGFTTVSYSYSTGHVQGHSSYSGGLVGWFTSGVAVRNYWDTQTSGMATSSGAGVNAVEGKTTAQMKQMTTFSGWDPGVWGLRAGVTYPELYLYHTNWTGAAGDGKWSTAANWASWNGVTRQYDAVVPGATDIVFFNSLGTTKASTIDTDFVAGSVGYLGVGSGYGNTLTQSRSLTLGDFAQGGGTFIGGDTMDINGFVLNGGSFTAPATINLVASWVRTGGTYVSNNGTVNFGGTTAQTVTSSGMSFNILNVNRTGTLQMLSNLTASGELTVSNGTLDPNLFTISEGGNWVFTNLNLTNLGSVVLTGLGKTLTSGGNQFKGLTISGTYSLADALYMRNALSVSGSLNAMSQTLTFEQNVNINNVFNLGAATATGTGYTITSGNGDFSSLTVSGTYTLSDALTATGDLATQGTGTIAAGGNSITEGGDWSFTGMSGLGSVTLTGASKWIVTPDPNTNQFNNLTVSGSYSLSGGLHVNGTLSVPGTLNASNQSMTLAGSLDLTNISNINNSTITLDGSGSITSANRQIRNLRVSGNYTLADNLHVNGWLRTDNGAQTPVQTGYLHANGKNMTLAGDLTIWVADDPSDLLPLPNGGDGDYQWVQRIDGFGSVTLDGSGSITSHTTELNDLTISGTYTLVDALHVNGALSVTGTLNAASQTMTLAENLNLTKISSAGNVVLDGASGTITSATKTVNNLTILGDYTLVDALHVNGALDLSAGTLDAASKDMTLNTGLDLTNITNPLNVTLDGPLGSITMDGKPLNNLTIQGLYNLTDALRVNGVLNVTAGQLNAGNNPLTLAGDFYLANIDNAHDVTLNGSGTITSNVRKVSGDLTITGNYLLADALTVDGDLSIQGAGALSAAAKTISEGGDWSFAGLSNHGNVILTGEDKTITSGVNEYTDLTILGTYALVDALHVNGVLDVPGGLDAAGNAMTIAGDLDLTTITNPGDVTLEGTGELLSYGRVLNSLTVLGDYSLLDGLTVAGDFSIQGAGAFDALTNTIVEGGDWSFAGLSHYGSVVLTGSGKTITSDGNEFSNLAISGDYELTDHLHVNAVFNFTGTLDAAGMEMAFADNLDLTNISNPGDLTLFGNGYLTSAGKVLNNLTIIQSNSLTDALHVNGILDVQGALDAANSPMTIAGDLDLSNITNPGNVTLDGSGSFRAAGKAVDDLRITGNYTLLDTAYVDGGFTVPGTLNANGNIMIVGQSLDLTNISNAGSVTLAGAGYLTSGGRELDNLTISGSYELVDDLHVNATLNLTGTLNASGNAMTLAQDLNLTNIANPGNVTLTGSGSITSAGKELGDLTITGDYSLADALHVNGTLDILGSLSVLGNAMTLSKSFDLTKIPDAQIVTLDGSGTITSGGRTINTLTISGAYTLVDALTVIGELALQGLGNLDAASKTITEGGDWVSTNFTNLGNVILTGSGKTLTSDGIDFGSLTINGVYSLVDALTVTGDLNVQGVLDAATNTISEGGNWVFTNISNVGAVTLTGTGKTITSSGNAFNDLTISGAYTLVDALRVNGSWNVTGSLDANGQQIYLAQSINITGLTGAGDMVLTGSGTITSGGNYFSNLTITGTYSLSDDLFVTGELDVQGALNAGGSHDITEGGNWAFTNISNLRNVTLTGSSKTITSAGNAFNDLLISGTYSLVDALHVNGALSVTGALDAATKAMTLAQDLDLTKISNAGDVTLDGAGSITSDGKSVQNLTISGVYSLVDALRATGNLSIPGSLNAAAQAVSVGGDWAFIGNLSNLGDVILTGSGKTITSGGNEFTNLTITGLYSLVDALHVNGVFDVSGALDAANKAMTLGGDLDLTNVTNAGDVTLDGSGFINSASKQVNDLVISGAYTLADALHVNGAMDVTGTLDASSKEMTFGESLNLTNISNARDVTLAGSGSINTAGQSLNDLTVSGDYTQASDLTVNGDFEVQSGGSFTDAAPLSHAFTVTGSFSVPYGSNAFRRYTGSGTAGDPFVIRTGYDLQGMKGNLASYFILNNNVDMASFSSWNNNAGFDPIGGLSNSFTGSLNGNGKVISNLGVSRAGSDYAGLFGNIGSSGSVTNLALENVSIYGGNYVGGLAGLNAGSLSNVYTTGVHTVSGVSYVGGLVGNNTGNIANAYSAARVSGTDKVGGLVGANSGSLNKTYAMGYVTGTTNTGGLVGSVGSGNVTSSFWDAVATGQSSRGAANEGTGVLASGNSNAMMNRSTYSDWDFGSTWVMDEGGTYPHFQFRYPTGVRGVWGHVYSAPGILAGSGVTVSIYSLLTGSPTETYLDSTVTNASSSYYVPLSTAAADEAYVVAYYLDGQDVFGANALGSSKMTADSGSLYPLYIVGGENNTLVPLAPTPTPGGGSVEVPLLPLPDYVKEGIQVADRSLVDSGNIPVPLPNIVPPSSVTIEDQTGGTETLVGGVPPVPELKSLILTPDPSVVVPSVSNPPRRPVASSKPQSQTDDSSDDEADNEADISVIPEPPVGQESVPTATEVKSAGANASWRSEQGGRETTTDIRINGSGPVVEAITTDIQLDEGVVSSDVPLLDSLGGEHGVEEITTDIRLNGEGITSDIRMIEGAGQ
jgi:hypothetical protein